jgi:arylformamidase
LAPSTKAASTRDLGSVVSKIKLGVLVMRTYVSRPLRLTRRSILGSAAATIAAPAALAQECRLGPPDHHKGPTVFMNYDQLELDAAYDQDYYEPLGGQTYARLASNSEAVRARIGAPLRVAYGLTEIEKLDIYRTDRPKAPIFVFIHGGVWLLGLAKEYGYPAEMFVNAGAHYVALDFASVKDAGGDLGVMAAQVRRAIAWIYKNAATFNGDADRIYVGGHSSGGHLCGVTLITDWEREFGVPATIVKGGLSMSGMYELTPVRLSWRSTLINFTDTMVDDMSSQRHIDKLNAPVIVSYGSLETPDFQRQSRDFAAAVMAAGKPVQLIEGPNYTHAAMCESLGHPYGPNGRAALAMMKLAPP